MKPDERLTGPAQFEIDGPVQIGVLESTDIAYGIPVLLDRLDFVRLDPAVIGLVVRKCTNHQFGIGSVCVGEDLIPGSSDRAGAPFPQFCSADNVVVGHMHDASVAPVVVTAHEIGSTPPGEEGVGDGRVLPPADVGASVVVTHVLALSDRPIREVDLRVVGGDLDFRWKDHLIVVIHMHGHVGPVQDRIGNGRSIDELDGGLDVRTVGIEGQANQPFHAMSAFGFTEPDGLAAVRVLDQRIVDRQVGRIAVMMKGAPFHAARDPRAEHADQRRLDHMLLIEEVVLIGLVGGSKQSPADFG